MASHTNFSSNSLFKRSNNFPIAQINVKHCAAAMDEAFAFFFANNISVMALQECYNRNGAPVGSDQHLHVISSGSDPAVCFIISKNTTFSFIREFSDSHFVCVECVLNDLPFYLINCYFQPSLDPASMCDKLDRLLSALQGRNLIILGDFNARSSLWGDLITNDRGTLLSELIFRHSLSIQNLKSSGCTFSSHLGSSIIDLTLSNLNDFMIVNWHIVRDCLILSDHFLIVFDLCPIRIAASSVSFSPPRSDSYLNFGRTNWFLLSRHIRSPQFGRKFYSCFSLDNPEYSISRFHILVNDVINVFVPRGVLPRFNHWWSPELSRLRAEVRAVNRRFLKFRRVSDRVSYRLARNRYVAAIRVHKANWILSSNLRDLYSGRAPWGSSFKLFFDKISPRGFPSVDGLSESCTRDALNDLLVSAFPDDNPSSDNPAHSDLREQFSNFCFTPRRFSHDISRLEVVRAFDRLRPGKAPGIDGIRAGFWKKFFQYGEHFFLFLFNFCLSTGYFPREWKSASIIFIPKGSGSSLRPISILPSIGKIFEFILNNRLAAHAESAGLISDFQFGFRPGSSTLHAIRSFQRAYLDSYSRSHILAAFLDISKAFDSAWWPDIFVILKRSGCPPLLLASVHSFFSDREVTVSFGSVSVSKGLSLGCPQGSIISPLLWNIYFNSIFDIPRNKFISMVAYADDLAILSSHYSSSLCESLLNNFLANVWEWSIQKKISFNVIKSVIMVLKGSSAWSPLISLGGSPSFLPIVSEFKYLGLLLSKNLHFQKHINFCVARGERRALMLFKLLKSNKVLSFSNMCLIYRSVIIPAFSYGVSFWFETASRPSHASKFISMQRKCLLAISGCFRTTSSVSLDLLVGILPIMIYLDSLHAREALRIFGSSSFGSYHFRFSNNSILTRLPSGDSFELSPPQFTALIRDLAFRAWNADWISSSFGRFTFKFFDTIYCRVSKTWLRPRGPLARFLSGHSLCSDYLTRFHLPSPVFCSCVPPSGSLTHDLQHCSQFSFFNSAFLGVDFSFLTDLTFYPLFLEFTKV